MAFALLGCGAGLGACGDTLQDKPIAASVLEQLVTVREFPVYWLGLSFERMAVTSAVRDPSGAFTVQYGDCVEGGQNTCVPPLSIVTSPDNSFHPAGGGRVRPIVVRGVRGVMAQEGKAIELPTGAVVVDVYAARALVAIAAAQALTPINRGALPGKPLPPPLPDSGFAERPLASQLPSPAPTPSAGG